MSGDPNRLEHLHAELDRLRERVAGGRAHQSVHVESNSMELLRSVLANAPGFIAMIAPDGTILFVNRVREGITLESVLGRSIYDYSPSTEPDALRACVAEVMRTGVPGAVENEARITDGRSLYFDTRVAAIRDGDSVIALTLMATDITERKRGARALRESEEKLRMAVEAAGIGLWSWDPTTDTVTWEDPLCAIFGLPPGTSPAGREGYLALVHPDDRQHAGEVIGRGVAAGRWEDEYRIVRVDGAVRWVLANGTVLRGGGGDIVLGAVIDVTERRLRDEQLRQAQKLEAVGQLTAGIAHNFNNMLMGVLPNLAMALRDAPLPLAPLLRDAQHAAQRAADLVRQLTTYAGRNRPAARRVESIGLLVERTVAICRTTFDRGITFEARYDASVRARVDAAQLEQAVLNVLINARDAVADPRVTAPRVQIDVSLVPAGSPELAERSDAAGADHARIQVKDNGVGMDAATLGRIYEPFFTTKDVGRGTGLGLATTHAIVREHGGWMVCGSTAGEGAAFSIFIPCDHDRSVVEHGATEPPPAGGTETLLVIDDEPSVRRIVATTLEAAGYAAKVAASGEEALAVLAEDGSASAVALILLDVSMPGMSRRELRARLGQLAPRARIVYFTGYAFEAGAEDFVLEKPVTQARLLRAVRSVIDRGVI